MANSTTSGITSPGRGIFLRGPSHCMGFVWRSKKLAKLFYGKAGVARNTTHRECIHRVVAGDSHDALAVAHDDMLALAHHPETGLLERADSILVIDARDLGQGSDSYFDFANILAAKLLGDDRQIFANSILDALECLLFGGALRPAPGKSGNGHAVAFVRLVQ